MSKKKPRIDLSVPVLMLRPILGQYRLPPTDGVAYVAGVNVDPPSQGVVHVLPASEVDRQLRALKLEVSTLVKEISQLKQSAHRSIPRKK